MENAYLENLATVIVSVILLFTYISRKIKAISIDTKQVKEQVVRNGGSSMLDAINRIEATLKKMSEKLTQMAIWSEAIEQLSNTPLFRTDCDGGITWANSAYMKMVGMDFTQVCHYGWVSVIAEKDIKSAREEWKSCVADHREFNSVLTVINKNTGKPIEVKIIARPVVNHNVLEGFVGAWYPTKCDYLHDCTCSAVTTKG